MKVIALYLPQYHIIAENDLWWGKGFTEWDNLKKGTVLVQDQYQPRVPLNNNYYDLLDMDVMRWQTRLAAEYGVYGFCVYHYWFNGKLLLEKPMENYLKATDIDYPYFFCWANEQWTTVWEGETKKPRLLIGHDYSERGDIERHFDYLLQFFRDSRYMKEDNKPIICIYNPLSIDYSNLKRICNTWKRLAIENGFNGLIFTYLCAESMCYMNAKKTALFDYAFEYQPSYIEFLSKNRNKALFKYTYGNIIHQAGVYMPKIKKTVKTIFEKFQNRNSVSVRSQEINTVKTICEYNDVWEKILNTQYSNLANIVPGAFTDWDNTPRRGVWGKVILHASPTKFKHYLKKQIQRTKNEFKKDAIVLFAWNEWSEGGYLEPDEKWGLSYLEAIRDVLHETNEFPKTYHEYKRVFVEEENNS